MVSIKEILSIFQKCYTLYVSFKDKHMVLLARVQTIANIVERLPALGKPDLYKLFTSDPRMHLEVSRAQGQVVEDTWEAAHESMCATNACLADMSYISPGFKSHSYVAGLKSISLCYNSAEGTMRSAPCCVKAI